MPMQVVQLRDPDGRLSIATIVGQLHNPWQLQMWSSRLVDRLWLKICVPGLWRFCFMNGNRSADPYVTGGIKCLPLFSIY